MLILIVPLFAVPTTGCAIGSSHLAIAQNQRRNHRGEQDQAENGSQNLSPQCSNTSQRCRSYQDVVIEWEPALRKVRGRGREVALPSSLSYTD
jgi:hypothetical protein